MVYDRAFHGQSRTLARGCDCGRVPDENKLGPAARVAGGGGDPVPLSVLREPARFGPEKLFPRVACKRAIRGGLARGTCGTPRWRGAAAARTARGSAFRCSLTGFDEGPEVRQRKKGGAEKEAAPFAQSEPGADAVTCFDLCSALDHHLAHRAHQLLPRCDEALLRKQRLRLPGQPLSAEKARRRTGARALLLFVAVGVARAVAGRSEDEHQVREESERGLSAALSDLDFAAALETFEPRGGQRAGRDCG